MPCHHPCSTCHVHSTPFKLTPQDDVSCHIIIYVITCSIVSMSAKKWSMTDGWFNRIGEVPLYANKNGLMAND
jgi:hypothetical protein